MSQHRGPQRNLPFLHRNWLVGITDAMGTRPGARQDGRDGGHPSKKRRVDPGPPSFFLPADAGDLQQMLCIEVLRVFHKDTSRVRFNPFFNGNTVPDSQPFRARCSVTISSRQGGKPRFMYKDSQVCDMKTYKNPVGPAHMARIGLPQPFKIPKEKLLVGRPEDYGYALADAYSILFEIEGAGDAKWPPRDLVKTSNDDEIFAQRPADRHTAILSAESSLFLPRWSSIPIYIEYPDLDANPQRTDLVLETAIRWTTGFSDQLVRQQLEKGIKPSITFVDPDEDRSAAFAVRLNGSHGNAKPSVNMVNGNGHLAHSPGANGHAQTQVNGDVTDDLDDEADGEITPSRSLRARGASKVYNLKELSDKAQGKERRRRRKLDSQYDKPGDDCKVIYNVPSEQLTLDGLTCGVCGARNESINLLRAHFLCHPNYNFDFEYRPGRGGHVVTMSPNPDASGVSMRPRIYQLGRRTRPLDLEKYIDGDDSWVTDRLGPDNDILQTHSMPGRPAQPRPKSTPGRALERKVLVPHTKKPLFDPLSKCQLQPGSEIPPPVCDDEWLAQKHRDHLQDFVDVEVKEKEYMIEWDSFNGKLRLNSEAYITRNLLAFVAKKASWLVASDSRINQLGTHLSLLLARGSIDRQVVHEAFARVAEARNQRKTAAAPEPAEASEPSPSAPVVAVQNATFSGCPVCSNTIPGKSLLLCTNKKCMRQYHIECARPGAKMAVESPRWLCNECARTP